HPLLCHMIDVALVAEAIWREVLSPAARGRIAAALGVGEVAAQRWVGFWAGLHDIGKASPAFARQDRSAWDRIQAAGFPCPPAPPTRIPHGTVTANVLPDLLQRSGFTP